MKVLLKKLVNYFGYNITRNIPPRTSMKQSIEWLQKSGFSIGTVLDVGASNGSWSKDCMLYFPEANYILFEPQTCHSEALDRLEKGSGGKIKIVKKAVGQKTGKTYFDITDPMGGALADSKTSQTVEVNLTSIDDTIYETGIKGPYLLKLDTHGFEIPILEGAAKALNECEILIIEAYNYNLTNESVLFWQLCDYLHKKGFRPIDLVDVSYRKFDNSLWQMDLVFIKSSWSGYQHNSYK